MHVRDENYSPIDLKLCAKYMYSKQVARMRGRCGVVLEKRSQQGEMSVLIETPGIGNERSLPGKETDSSENINFVCYKFGELEMILFLLKKMTMVQEIETILLPLQSVPSLGTKKMWLHQMAAFL